MRRVVHDVADKFIAAAGDDQVDVLIQFEHRGDIGAGFEQSQPAGGHARFDGGFGDDLGQDAIGVQRPRSRL